MFFATNTDEVLSGAIKSNRFQVALKIVRELTQSRNIVNENDWLSLFKVSTIDSALYELMCSPLLGNIFEDNIRTN